MVPEISDSAALHLEHRKRVLRSEVKTAPDAVAELACSMLHHVTMMESIMRKATHRIAELELSILLSVPSENERSSADGSAPCL